MPHDEKGEGHDLQCMKEKWTDMVVTTTDPQPFLHPVYSLTTHEHDCPAQKLILFPSIAYSCSFSLKSYALILHCPWEEWTLGTQSCKEN